MWKNEAYEIIARFKQIMEEVGVFDNVNDLSHHVMNSTDDDVERFTLLAFIMNYSYVQGDGFEQIVYNQPLTCVAMDWLKEMAPKLTTISDK